MARFIVRDPLFDLLLRDVARWRERAARRVQTSREEQQQFLLILRWERFGGGFDFSERAHVRENARCR